MKKILDRAFRDARKDFLASKDDFGYVPMDAVRVLGVAFIIAALIVTVASGKSDADVLFAGALAVIGLSGIFLANSGDQDEPNDSNT